MHAPPSENLRLLLYCHNVFGLGHIVRSLRIAEQAARLPNVECRVVTGCRFLDALTIPEGVDIVRLRPVKEWRGMFVDAENGDLSALAKRSRVIDQLIREWQPQAVLVDHIPLGLGGELLTPLLATLKSERPPKFVLGRRDVQLLAYQQKGTEYAPNKRHRKGLECYSAAVAYSEAHWIDTFEDYHEQVLPEVMEYVGVVTTPPLPPLPRSLNDDLILTALAGGGAKGRELFELLASALKKLDARDVRLRVVAGPLGDIRDLQSLENVWPNVEIRARSTAEEAVRDASLVVSRCGYNTAYSIIQTGLPIIFAPYPQEEQNYRACRMAELDKVWAVDERKDDVSDHLVPALGQALEAAREHGRSDSDPAPRPLPFAVNGAENAARWLADAAALSFES